MLPYFISCGARCFIIHASNCILSLFYPWGEEFSSRLVFLQLFAVKLVTSRHLQQQTLYHDFSNVLFHFQTSCYVYTHRFSPYEVSSSSNDLMELDARWRFHAAHNGAKNLSVIPAGEASAFSVTAGYVTCLSEDECKGWHPLLKSPLASLGVCHCLWLFISRRDCFQRSHIRLSPVNFILDNPLGTQTTQQNTHNIRWHRIKQQL